jgi:hypothetical protein
MDKEKAKLAAQEKAILLQKQIMDNSRNINEYYKDFESWVEEMNEKDNKLLNIQSKEPKKEAIINEDAEIELKKEKIRKAKELARQNKLKRDGNSIKDYYDNWDKVNEDDELIDVESKISMNATSNEEIIKNLYNEKQKSNADKNVSISIKSNRNTNLKNTKIIDEITERIEKLKKESNINYLIENYNKSIELYTYAIELLPKLNKNNVEENRKMTINLYNNRGNCQIKMKNYKVGIKDFTKVLNIDPNNLKGLYRRGICYLNTDKYNLAFDDLMKAYNIASEGNEKNEIKKELNNVISKINSTIQKERKKMTAFIFNENAEFIKMKINDLPSSKILRDTDNLISVQIKESNNKNEKQKTNKDNNKENKTENNNSFNVSKKNYEEKKILKKEDIRKFIYDNQMDNISASSFKYAFKNFGNDIAAKKDFLLKINPTKLPTIFKTDLDKDSLLDIFRCFNLFEDEYQVVEYLKNIIKIPRIKLVIQLISKKYKNIILDVLDNLEKGEYGSEVIPIKDFFHNN